MKNELAAKDRARHCPEGYAGQYDRCPTCGAPSERLRKAELRAELLDGARILPDAGYKGEVAYFALTDGLATVYQPTADLALDALVEKTWAERKASIASPTPDPTQAAVPVAAEVAGEVSDE